MDQVTFRSDTVLSDVHLLIPNARHLMTRLNSAGQPGERFTGVQIHGVVFVLFIRRFRILDSDWSDGVDATDSSAAATALVQI